MPTTTAMAAALATPIVGCTGDPNNLPPVGYIAGSNPNSNTDCDDTSNQINPGVSTFSQSSTWTSTWKPNFDWNCDGVVEYEYPTLYQATCEFCNPATTCSSIIVGQCTGPACGGVAGTCASGGQFAYLNCAARERTSGNITHENYCCGYGCSEVIASGGSFFTAALYSSAYTGVNYTVPCGQTATLQICGSCAATGGAPGSGVENLPVPNQPQGCQ